MLTDPIEFTQSAVDYDFVRTGVSANGAQYRTADGLRRLGVVHQQTGKGNNARNRIEVRLDTDEVGADAFVDGLSHLFTHSVYTVFNVPVLGTSSFTVADSVSEHDKLLRILDGGSMIRLTRILQGES